MFKKNSSIISVISLFSISFLIIFIHAFSYHNGLSHIQSQDKITIAKIVKDETLTSNIGHA